MHEFKPLSHSLTPFELQHVNQEIELLLGSDQTDTQRLGELIDERHYTVIDLLSRMSEHERKSFAHAETRVNDYLNTFIGAMHKESSDVLHSFQKGRKAINKYNQAF